MKYRDKKLGRYRKGVVPFSQQKQGKTNVATLDGKWVIKARYAGVCAICGHRYDVDRTVMYDPNKPAGKKVAHVLCYEDQKGQR